MVRSSFRDILAQFLEEKSENFPLESGTADREKRFQPEPTPLLQWQKPEGNFTKKNGYPPPPPRQKAPAAEAKSAPLKPAPRPERVFTLHELSPLDQDAVATLTALGAVELKSEITAGNVKKAHRRLAKALHPDRIVDSLSVNEKIRRRERFLMLQAAYETLSRSLKALSDSACGSESASASDSRRRDAA